MWILKKYLQINLFWKVTRIVFKALCQKSIYVFFKTIDEMNKIIAL